LATDTPDERRRLAVEAWRPIERPFRAPLSSKLLALAVLIVLAFDFPANWFRVSPRDAGVSDASAVGPLAGYFLVAATALALFQLAKSLDVLAWGVRCEPLIPLMLTLALFSVIWSARPSQTIETVVSLWCVLILGYWFVALFTFRQIMLLVGVALGIGTFAHLAFVFGLPQYGTNGGGGWDGVLIHENALGRSSALAIFHFLFLTIHHRAGRFLWAGLAGLSLYLLIGSTSKTGLATAALLPILAWIFHVFRAKKTLYGASLLAIGTAAIGAVLVATANLQFLVGDLLQKDVTLSGRTDLWSATLAEARTRLLFGFGWDGFWGGWFSPAHEVLASRTWSPPHSHNALLEYLLALGLTGVVLGAAIFLRLTTRGIAFVRSHDGILGLWPLTFASYAVLFSTTEVGVITRDLPFLLLVIAVVTVGSSARGLENPLRRAHG
jgi:O-antigen ligase